MSLASQVLTAITESDHGLTEPDIQQSLPDRRPASVSTARMLLAGNGYIKATDEFGTTTVGSQHRTWIITDAGREHLAEPDLG